MFHGKQKEPKTWKEKKKTKDFNAMLIAGDDEPTMLLLESKLFELLPLSYTSILLAVVACYLSSQSLYLAN